MRRNPEQDIRIGIRNFLTALGCLVYDMEQGRPTRQTAGFPDLVWVWREAGWIGFWEVKTAKGKRSPAQVVFGDAIEAAKKNAETMAWGMFAETGLDCVDYYVPRSVGDAKSRLVTLGLIREAA